MGITPLLSTRRVDAVNCPLTREDTYQIVRERAARGRGVEERWLTAGCCSASAGL